MAATYSDTQLLIDNVWRDAQDGRTLDVVNPADDQVIGHVAHAGKADLDAALAAAQRGFDVWRTTPAPKRQQLMRAAAALVRERVDVIATLMTMEQGKPLAQARSETLACADQIDWFADEGRRVYGRIVPGSNLASQQMVLKHPIGPIAAFTPWNFPLNQVMRKLGPALAMGCSFLCEALEETPASPAAFLRCFVDAGIPEGGDWPCLRHAGGNLGLPDREPGHPHGELYRLSRGRQAARRQSWCAHEEGCDGAGRPCAGDCG